jgi:hypothetical protein
MQPQGSPMLGCCCVLCHRFMQTLANSTVAGIPQWPVLPRPPLLLSNANGTKGTSGTCKTNQNAFKNYRDVNL